MYVQMRVKMSRWELVSTYKQTTAGTIQPQREKTAPRDHQLGPRGYIHIDDHNVQTSSSLKPLGQSKPNFMWSILRKSE